jgi:hypothetical protein
MKIDCDVLSLANESTADVMLLNSPEAVVPLRTTRAPRGGEVHEAAKAVWHVERMNDNIGQMERTLVFAYICALKWSASKNARRPSR